MIYPRLNSRHREFNVSTHSSLNRYSLVEVKPPNLRFMTTGSSGAITTTGGIGALTTTGGNGVIGTELSRTPKFPLSTKQNKWEIALSSRNSLVSEKTA